MERSLETKRKETKRRTVSGKKGWGEEKGHECHERGRPWRRQHQKQDEQVS